MTTELTPAFFVVVRHSLSTEKKPIVGFVELPTPDAKLPEGDATMTLLRYLRRGQ